MKPPVSIEKDDLKELFELPQMKAIAKRKPHVVETGTWMGGSALVWYENLKPSYLLSVDKIKQAGFIAIKPTKDQEVEYIFFDKEGHDMNFRWYDAITKHQDIDFLFIDGDHSYEGVKRDFEGLSKFVKKGGVIVFHDALYHADGTEEVDIFWNEIKGKYKHVEIKSSPNSTGMGVLFL